MREALTNLKILTNQNCQESAPHDVPTPCFNSQRSSASSQSQYCQKCEPIIRQLCGTLEKLLAHKNYASNLILKKEEEFISVFRLLQESEQRTQYLLNCLEERNKQLDSFKERFEKLQEQFRSKEQNDQDKNHKIIQYLKAREYQLLTRIKGLELQLINAESTIETERLKYASFEAQNVQTSHWKQPESILSTRRKTLKNESLSYYEDSQMKSRRSAARKNESMNLDCLDTEADIQIREDLNPQIPSLLLQMQENMRTLMQQQRILMDRNQYLEKKRALDGLRVPQLG